MQSIVRIVNEWAKKSKHTHTIWKHYLINQLDVCECKTDAAVSFIFCINL